MIPGLAILRVLKKKFAYIMLFIGISVSLELRSQSISDPCASREGYHIVVIGSSTAAGAGASVPDSAWVNRYRSFLQSLNPQYQITNLAQGGYHTYKLMPDGFQPPFGRPLPDSAKNISAAIALLPNAIIMNLPSNDVALGYSLAEQIFNMDSIFSTSVLSGIPIWICTTQPRNFGAIQLQMQEDMKDSIIAHFSPFVIDFWNGLALPNNSLDPFFDSGDGVHLNDRGHRLLFERAIGVNIPGYLFQTPLFPDLTALKIEHEVSSQCGDTSARFQVIIGNASNQIISGFRTHFGVYDQQNIQIYADSIWHGSSVNACGLDTASFDFNTTLPGNYTALAYVELLQDSNSTNDSSFTPFSSIGRPAIQTVDDTLCEPGYALLTTISEPGDTVLWYSSMSSTQPIQGGSSFPFGFIQQDTGIYAQAVRGNLFYKESAVTTRISNIDWNGTMFDLIPLDTIYLDSLSLKIADAGLQALEIYSKNGSHIGFEQNAAPWTLLTLDTVMVNAVSDFYSVSLHGLQLLPGDTLGLYIQMSDPSSRLSYHSLSSPVERSTGELKIFTGTGISHHFSGQFFPRDWNGEIFYHFGERLEGECATERKLVKAYYSDQEIEFTLSDSIVSTGQTFNLSINDGFSNIQWITGQTGQAINYTIPASGTPWGSGFFSVLATDSLGCLKRDSIFVLINGLGENQTTATGRATVHPNPNNGRFMVTFPMRHSGKVLLLDGQNRILDTKTFEDQTQVNLDFGGLGPAVYFLKIQTSGTTYLKKLIISRE